MVQPSMSIQKSNARAAFSRRLNEALDRAGVPPKGQGRQLAVAKLFGVSQKGARKWLEGEAVPATARLPGMARALGVTTEWLLSGAGQAPAEKMEPPARPPVYVAAALDLELISEIFAALAEFEQRSGTALSHRERARVFAEAYSESVQARGVPRRPVRIAPASAP